MQTTLLGLGIAVILALVAALVGPHFIDWSEYRATFEAQASRTMGAPVRIGGKIDARLLPTPSLILHDVQVENASGPVSAREAFVEFSLGALMQGQWRATDARLVGLSLSAGLDSEGRIVGMVAPRGIGADTLTIERLRIEDSRIALTDARSGTQLVIENFWFGGDVRSLAGPVRGEGGGIANSERFGYRVSIARPTDEGARMRLTVEPSALPYNAEIDGLLTSGNTGTRFDGAVTVARLAGAQESDADVWKITSRVKTDAARALFEQLELSYGPAERALKLTGTAEFAFGADPRLDAVLSARQIDLDRLAALGEGVQPPSVILRAVANAFEQSVRIAIPMRIGLGIDQVTLAGNSLQNLRGDFASRADGWEIEALEFRAPGMAQVRTSGSLTGGADLEFAGAASVEAGEPRLLAAWLEGRRSNQVIRTGALRATGDITLSRAKLAVERLKADIDGKPVTGRFVLSEHDRIQRFEADLKAAEFDLDAAQSLARAFGLEARWPDEITLALDFGRATVAGVEARGAKAKLRLDADKLKIERLTIDDLSGAAVVATGDLQGPWSAPAGTLTIDVSGRTLDGAAKVLAGSFPQFAETIERVGPQLAPAKLRATVVLASPKETTADVKLDGTAGAFRVAITSAGRGDAANWRKAAITSAGRIDTDDARMMVRALGLDRAFSVAHAAGALSWKTQGASEGFALDASLALPGLQASSAGAYRMSPDGIGGRADVSFAAQDATALRIIVGRPGAAPLSFKSKVTVEPQRWVFDSLTGALAGSPFTGRLSYTRDLGTLDGRIETDRVDATALLAALLGAPAANPNEVWPVEPFGGRFLAGTEGTVELRAKTARFAPAIELGQMYARLRFGEGVVALDDIKGTLAGGNVAASFSAPINPQGSSAEVRVSIRGADVAPLFAPARGPISGKLTLQLEARGAGRGAAGIVAALSGSGTLSVEQIVVTGVDAGAMDSVLRLPDQDSMDAAKIRALVEAGLKNAKFEAARADAAFTITGGQARFSNLLAKGKRGNVAMNAGVDLLRREIDARLTMISDAGADAAVGRPEINLMLKGPLASPQRTLDVSALVGWLALRSVDRQAKRLETLEAERAAVEASLERARSRPSAAPPQEPTPAVPNTQTEMPERMAPANVPPPQRPGSILDLFGASR